MAHYSVVLAARLVCQRMSPYFLRNSQYIPVKGVSPTVSQGLLNSTQYVSKGKVIPLQARYGPEGSMTAALEGEWSAAPPRPHFTPGKNPVPILQEAGWVPGPIWPGRKSRPHRDSIPDLPARSQSLYRLSYPAHQYVSPVHNPQQNPGCGRCMCFSSCV